MATKVINIPMPEQWTLLLARKMAEKSNRAGLPFQWAAAEAGGMAMVWEREQKLITKRKPGCTFTLIIQNNGEILFFSERNGFGQTDGFFHVENDLHDLADELFNTIQTYL
jgi:hypothetical protein